MSNADNNGPTNHALTRLAHKGGVKKLAAGVYEDARGIFNAVLDKALARVCNNEDVVASQQASIVKGELDVVASQQASIVKGELDVDAKQQASIVKGELDVERVLGVTPLTDDMCIPRAAFKRLVINRRDDVRWSANALKLLQIYTETFVVNVFHQANMYAHHAGRETLQTKDMQLVGKVRGEW